MAADSSIYFQQQAPDILGNVVRGLGMRAQMDQNARLKAQDERTKAVDAAYKNGLVTNADGTTTLDQNKVLSGLGQVGGKEYLDAKTQFDADALTKQKNQYEQLTRKNSFISSAANTALKNPVLYPQIRNDLISSGMVTAAELPEQYDENFVRSAISKGQTLQQQLDNDFRNAELQSREADRKEAREERRFLFNVGRQDKADEKANAALRGDNMPIDQKKTVETLSTKNANKEAIKNQIDAVMSNWDSLSEDQKVSQGRQLLKTLNSTEGADAIGAEEANRLGAKLEFALGNFTNSNPTQFGRDLEGFKTQAKLTSKAIGDAVNANQAIIDKNMNRTVRVVDGVRYRKVEGGWLPE